MLFPFELLVVGGTKPVDIVLGATAQPDFRPLDSPDYAGGKVHRATKEVTLLHKATQLT